MESADLKIFQAVAREGSITKAAARLGYVQSNVTARIRQLEAELNTSLLYRQSRGVSLTPAGENLLKYADKIVYLLDEAVKSTRNSETPSGTLRIGSLETTAAVQLPVMMWSITGVTPTSSYRCPPGIPRTWSKACWSMNLTPLSSTGRSIIPIWRNCMRSRKRWS